MNESTNTMAWVVEGLPSTEEIEQAVSINDESTKIETNSTMEEAMAAMEQGDNPIPNEVKDPRTFSLQPLCEAYKLAGGVSPQQREMSAQARVLESGVRDAEERVETGSPLTEDEEQAKPESLMTGFDRTKEVLQNALDSSALFLQREGNLTLSAQNGVRISSLQGTTITGANTFLSTATTLINSQVATNSSETIINVSDMSLTRVNGSSTTHVEDTNQLTTSNNITRASETSQTIANRTYNHGVELNSTTGSTVMSTAGSGGHTIHSSGNVSTFTDSSVLTLATEQITVGAGSPSSNGPTPAAEPDFSILDHVPDAASFMRIIAGDSPGITSVTSGDTSTVSKGSQLTTANSTYTSAARTAAQVAGRQLMNGVMNQGGSPRSHVYHQGNMIIQGKMIGGFPSVDLDALLFPTVPPLPPKPTAYTIEDLQACIPKAYKKDAQTNEGWVDGEYSSEEAQRTAEALGVDQETIRRNAGSPSTSGKTMAEVTPGESATEQDISTSNSEITQGSPVGSSPTNIAQMIAATTAGGGPTNVYPDIYEEDSHSREETTAQEDEQNLLSFILSEIEPTLSQDLADVSLIIIEDLYKQGYRGSEENIEPYIKGVIETLKEDGIDIKERDYRAIIIDLMERMKAPLTSQAMGMFQDLGSYPTISLPQIGSVGQILDKSFGLGNITSIVDNLTDINSLEGVSSSDLLGAIGLEESDLSSVSNPQELLNLVADPNVAEILKRESIRAALEKVVGKKVAASVTQILDQVLKGVSIEEDELEDIIINTLELEGLTAELPSNYLSLINPIVETVVQGGVLDIGKEEILSILSNLLGNETPFKILSSYREVESIIGNVRALSSIPDLLGLMEDNDVPIISRASLLLSCLDIFNRVKSIMGSFDSIFNNLGDISFEGLAEDESGIVESAIETITTQENRIRELNQRVSSPISTPTTQALPDSTDTRVILLGDGLVYRSKVIERDDRMYLVDDPDVEVREDGFYKRQNKQDDLSNKHRISNLKYYFKDEIAQIREGDSVVWNNPSWSVKEEEGTINITREKLPTIEQPEAYSLNYKPYVRSTNREVNNLSSRFIESLPRAVQFLNLIRNSSYKDIQSITNLGATQSEADYLTLIKNSTVPFIEAMADSVCFPIPKLDPYQSEIKVLSIKENLITFSSMDKSVAVGINTPIQLEIRNYRRLGYQLLEVESSNRYYNPIYINYRVTSYSKVEGMGLARLETNQRLMLQSLDGVMYKYYTSDIGKKIHPVIEASYYII